MAKQNQLIPATILTGFLGSGKTTLLKRILTERHGEKIAVIENEFGEEGIDNDILVQDKDEQIVEMNNGCICCTVRGDLVRILGELAEKKRKGKLKFDRVIIETTGMADPGPVAQTFFMDEAIHEQYVLDAIITVVDSKHGAQQLTDNREARAQVGFADRILLSKTDISAAEETSQLMARLRQMNPRATMQKVNFGETDLKEILDIRGFNLNSVLEIEPDFLTDDHHTHSDDVQSFVWKDARPLDMEKIETFLSLLVQTYGADMLRYKGVLSIEGQDNRMIFQGVHMLLGGSPGKAWLPGEARESKMVFIGRNLPKRIFVEGLAYCVAGADDKVTTSAAAGIAVNVRP
jgi:G3E family GTPase